MRRYGAPLAGVIAIAAAAAAMVPAAAQQGGSGAPTAGAPAKPWYKLPWNPANVKPCDRACLVDIGEAYLAALISKDRSALPFAEQVAATENTGHIVVGQGLLWHAALQPTRFKIVLADPVNGQVAIQAVLMIEGKPALVALRLRVERNMITEVEQLYDRNVAPEAMELLQTPRASLVTDVPVRKRVSRDYLKAAAEAYFDALTGEDGKIAPFAKECIRHEQGYQTVNNKQPGRAAPSPALPDLKTEMGRTFSKLSTMTCEQQIDTKIFTGIKRIWPHRALVIDEQKQVVATFPFFIHDGTRRPVEGQPRGGLGMVTNLVMMESFAIRDGQIQDVEAFPFVTIPYGTGDGWDHADVN